MKRPIVRRDRGTESAAIGRTGASALVAFTVLAALFSSRFSVPFPGYDADVSIVTILAPLVAITTVVRLGSPRTLGFLQNSAFVLMVAPFLALMFVLPWFGVFFNGYGVQTLYSLTAVTTWVSFLIIGAAVSGAGARSWSTWLAVAIGLQFLYSVAQAAWLGGGPVADVLRPLIQWDLTVAGDDILFGRSSGLYTNPNILGFWAAVATMLALTLVSPAVRPIALVLAILTLVLSQSRGATAALLVAGAIGAVGTLLVGRIPKSQLKSLAWVLLLLLLLAPVVVTILPAQSFGRFEALADVLAQGAGADRNLAGRIDFWVEAADLSRQYPLGTWGPPEAPLGTAIDSEWFSAFAQGSIVLVFAQLLLLLAPVGVGTYQGRHALWLLAIVIAVAGITQTPMSYAPIFLFWALLGSGLQWAVDHRWRRIPLSEARLRAGSRTAARSLSLVTDDGDPVSRSDRRPTPPRSDWGTAGQSRMRHGRR